jgi:AcrR family transcriptional regulator
MVEAVARDGYVATSVSQVIALAGVSRRSFYEHFANREDCFLATFDVLARRAVRRVAGACADAPGAGLAARLGAALGALVDLAREEPDPTRLVVVEALTVGASGAARLRSALQAGEVLLTRCLRATADARPLPRPLVIGMTGGIHGVLAHRLRHAPGSLDAGLAEELLRWSLALQPRSPSLLEDLNAAALHRVRELAATRAAAAPEPLGPADCFGEAQEGIAGELLGVIERAQRSGPGEPAALRRAVAELLQRLAASPVLARTVASTAFAAGADAAARNEELLLTLARRLVAATPALPGGTRTTSAAAEDRLDASAAVPVEAAAGALWHTLACLQARGRVELLPAFADHLSFLVLAPAVGADAAIRELARAREEDAQPRRRLRRSAR